MRERTPVLVDISDSETEDIPRPKSHKKHKKRKSRSHSREEKSDKGNKEAKESDSNGKCLNQESEASANEEVAPVLKSVIGNVIINGKISNILSDTDLREHQNLD